MKYCISTVDTVPSTPSTRHKKRAVVPGRAAEVHLRFAEAANRDGLSQTACALLTRAQYHLDTSNVAGRDVTNLQNTLTYRDPYKSTPANGDYPRYRATGTAMC